MSTLVSVCIPVYNGEPFIRQTIEMVLAQDYDNMEVLVSDNASTDHTVDEIKKVKDKRVRILQNDTNLGMGGNWNCLLKQAKGEYIIIVCADDFILSGAIKEKARVLDENPSVNIVFSSTYIFSEKGKRILKRRPFKGNQKLSGEAVQKELFQTKNFFAEPPNNMLRKSAVEQVGDFDNNLWYDIDWDYWLRILNTGDAYYLDTPYAGFRLSAGSATGSSGLEKILRDEAVFVEKYRTNNIIPVTEEMFQNRKKSVESRAKKRELFLKLIGLLWRNNK